MKHILFLLVSSFSLMANAQKQVVVQSENHSANYSIQGEPKLVVDNEKLILTDRKTEATFSANERVVLVIKKDNNSGNTPQGDVNGDNQVSISDVSKLVDILLQKTE